MSRKILAYLIATYINYSYAIDYPSQSSINLFYNIEEGKGQNFLCRTECKKFMEWVSILLFLFFPSFCLLLNDIELNKKELGIVVDGKT